MLNQDDKAKIYGIDLGGTLIKICFYNKKIDQVEYVKNYIRSDDINSVIAELQSHKFNQVVCTGGGFVKYKKELEEVVPSENLHHLKEFESLYKGIQGIHNLKLKEIFQFSSTNDKIFVENNYIENIFPCLIVQIGSGMGYFKVEKDSKVTRLSGSAVAGNVVRGLKFIFNQIEQDNDKLQEQFNDDELAEEIYLAQIANISNIVVILLQIHNLQRVVFSGNFPTNLEGHQRLNKNILKILEEKQIQGVEVLFIENFRFLSALGCIYYALNDYQ